MSKHLERELDHLRQALLAMAALVEEAVHRAIRALQRRDVALAKQVIAGDSRIDATENRLNEDCLKILALHQPVAVDLRKITAAMMISTDLERIGDLAEEIAEQAIQLAHGPAIPVPDRLQPMTDQTTLMVRKALDAFVQLDARQARAVLRLDDAVDDDHRAIIRELIGVMQRTPELVESAVALFSVTRNLERIADHATNIAEDIVYLVEGEIVRHRPAAVQNDP